MSVATVSRVFRNLPGVGAEISERVRKVLAGKDGFRPRVKVTKRFIRPGPHEKSETHCVPVLFFNDLFGGIDAGQCVRGGGAFPG